jgi:hypothetical protein
MAKGGLPTARNLRSRAMSSNILHDKYLTAIEESAEASYRHRFEISEKAEVLLRDHGSFWEILDDIADLRKLHTLF